jgi:short subunit dehydrogenase-like uncharacterized protein
MTDDFLLYGSYGYTGDLIARAAVEAGLSPTLAGRDREQVEAQAAELGLETSVFGLDSSEIVERKLDDASIVLNCAGPFIHTYEPLVEACLETGTHYLDITGEIDVFEAIAAREERAAEAGVMALPGVGFDVVPSDCLANHLVEQLPEATHLALGFTDLGGVSPGTAATVVESLGGGSVVREDGDLREVPLGERTRTIDFGEGARLATSIPWGDVSTAYRSTGIPNVEFYTGVSETELRVLKNLRSLGWLLGSGPVQTLLRAMVERGVSGPDERERRAGESLLWGEVRDGAGNAVTARLHGPETYAFTVETALAVLERVLDGDAPAGYQMPATAYGDDLVLDVEGVTIE